MGENSGYATGFVQACRLVMLHEYADKVLTRQVYVSVSLRATVEDGLTGVGSDILKSCWVWWWSSRLQLLLKCVVDLVSKTGSKGCGRS